MFLAVLALGLAGLCVWALIAGAKRRRDIAAGVLQAPVQQDGLMVGGALAGHSLVATDDFFEWKHVYGNGFKVPRKLVTGVTVEKTGWGKATLRVIGGGAELAKVPDLAEPWANQAQAWFMQRLGQ